MNRATSVAVLALTLAAAACEQSGTSVSANQPQSQPEVSDEPGVANLPASAAAPAANPQQFVTQLAGSDLFEIASGQLAQEKGESADVRSMGATLVEEHRKASNELKALLAQSNPPIAMPAAPPPELQARLTALQGLSGAEFDRRWTAEQIAAHQQSLSQINGFLASAQPGPLKDHASKASGIIQKHLNQLNRTAG